MKIEQLHSHIAYTLEDGDRLSDLGLKTLQNRPAKYCAVPGKLLINGSTRLVYPTEELSSVSVLSSRLGESQAHRIITGLSALLKDLDDSAFLDKRYLDLSPEHVYVKQEDESPVFILVPVEGSFAGSQDMVKSFICSMISRCINTPEGRVLSAHLPGIQDPESGEFAGLDTGTILDAIKDLSPSDTQKTPLTGLAHEEIRMPESGVTTLAPGDLGNDGGLEEVELRYRGVHGAFAFFDRKEEFFIGKEDRNDGVIGLNPAVSRSHCKIINNGRQCFVEDMGSKNGTAINGRLILPGQMEILNTGDSLRIADMEFSVTLHNARM